MSKTRNPYPPETIAHDLNVLAIGLNAQGNLAGARVCRRAATELLLKIAEDQVLLARAAREDAERVLIEKTAAAVTAAMQPGYKSMRAA